MKRRTSNNPKRRIKAKAGSLEILENLAEGVRYVGHPCHKINPADYNFMPPCSPRPNKSLCDKQRVIRLAEAESLLKEGILKGLVSDFISESSVPKYVWSVDKQGDVYEAKTNPEHETAYHGYCLSDTDDMKKIILEEWKKRCQTV